MMLLEEVLICGEYCGGDSFHFPLYVPGRRSDSRPRVGAVQVLSVYCLISSVVGGVEDARRLALKPFVRQPRGDTRVTSEDKQRFGE